MKTILIILLVVLSVTGAFPVVAGSEQPKTGQDEDRSSSTEEKEKGASPDQDQFFMPLKPSSEGSFLLLDPDGKTPSDYDKFLSPLDQPEKKPNR